MVYRVRESALWKEVLKLKEESGGDGKSSSSGGGGAGGIYEATRLNAIDEQGHVLHDELFM